MRIAVSSKGGVSDATFDGHFNRCEVFTIMETDIGETTRLPNPGADIGAGAGPRAAAAVISAGVEAVVTGWVGPHAHAALVRSGITVHGVPPHSIADAVTAWKEGTCREISADEAIARVGTGATIADGDDLSGAVGGPGQGRGLGLGFRHRHGAGGGHGRRMGMGFGRGRGRASA